MKKDIPTWMDRVHRWFMSFNMCKCPSGPYYIVKDGILKCQNCNKPAAWLENPKNK